MKSSNYLLGLALLGLLLATACGPQEAINQLSLTGGRVDLRPAVFIPVEKIKADLAGLLLTIGPIVALLVLARLLWTIVSNQREWGMRQLVSYVALMMGFLIVLIGTVVSGYLLTEIGYDSWRMAGFDRVVLLKGVDLTSISWDTALQITELIRKFNPSGSLAALATLNVLFEFNKGVESLLLVMLPAAVGIAALKARLTPLLAWYSGVLVFWLFAPAYSWWLSLALGEDAFARAIVEDGGGSFFVSTFVMMGIVATIVILLAGFLIWDFYRSLLGFRKEASRAGGGLSSLLTDVALVAAGGLAGRRDGQSGSEDRTSVASKAGRPRVPRSGPKAKDEAKAKTSAAKDRSRKPKSKAGADTKPDEAAQPKSGAKVVEGEVIGRDGVPVSDDAQPSAASVSDTPVEDIPREPSASDGPVPRSGALMSTPEEVALELLTAGSLPQLPAPSPSRGAVEGRKVRVVRNVRFGKRGAVIAREGDVIAVEERGEALWYRGRELTSEDYEEVGGA